MSTLYCRPSDVVTDSATVTLAAGTADSAYPLTNLYDRKAYSVFKATGTSCTPRATFGGSQTIQAAAVIQHNLAGATVTVTNGAGFSNDLTVPSDSEDGHSINPWEDYRGLSNTASTQWNLAVSGASANVAIGEWALVQTLRTLPIIWGVIEDESHPVSRSVTDYGVDLNYGMGVRSRIVRCEVKLDSMRADLVSLQRDARGALKPFLFVLDSSVNDAMWVTLETDVLSIVRKQPRISSVELIFKEQQRGLAL